VNIAILDDYANAALTLADWSAVSAQSRIQVFTTHLPDDEISAVLQPFDIVCTVRERTTFSRPLIESLPALKLIVVTDQRVTTIDYAAAKERGVLVCIGKPPLDLVGKPSGSAEFAWALIMATVRHIPIESERLRQGGWQHTLGLTLAGCTLGLVGLGNIGSRIARYARAFDMNVLAWSQNLTDETAN
jgi:phosphoglycerate dehydrogenase-like enzyme